MDVLTSKTCWAVNWHNKASVIKLVYLYSNISTSLSPDPFSTHCNRHPEREGSVFLRHVGTFNNCRCRKKKKTWVTVCVHSVSNRLKDLSGGEWNVTDRLHISHDVTVAYLTVQIVRRFTITAITTSLLPIHTRTVDLLSHTKNDFL